MEGYIATLVTAFGAILLVLFLHELGHRPKRIRTKPWYAMAAMQADSRLGGLMVNAALFTGIFLMSPDNYFLALVGAFAWLHFIYYMVFGSFNYEPNERSVNMKTYVWDDVPNGTWVLNLILAGASYYYMYSYYIPILKGLIP